MTSSQRNGCQRHYVYRNTYFLLILTGDVPAEKAQEVRAEMLHMLAKEAWRNPLAFDAFMQMCPKVGTVEWLSENNHDYQNQPITIKC